MAVLVVTDTGLLLRDDYNRPDADPIDNGWSEGRAGGGTPGVDLKLAGQTIVHGVGVAASDRWFRTSPAMTLPGCVQTNQIMREASAAGGVVLRCNSPAIDSLGYIGYWDENTNLWHIGREQAPGGGVNVGDVDNFNTWMMIRFFIFDAGGGLVRFELWGKLVIGGRDVMTVDPVQKLTWTDPNAPVTSQYWGGILGWREGESNNTFGCKGSTVTVRGVPAGYTVQVDSRAPVISSGSDVVFDARGWAYPMSTVAVTLGGSPIASVSGDFYGGSIFDLGGVSPLMAAGRPSRFFAGDLVVERSIGISGGVVYLITGQGDPDGVVSAPVGSQFNRIDGGPWVYIKTSGGNTATGWVAKVL